MWDYKGALLIYKLFDPPHLTNCVTHKESRSIIENKKYVINLVTLYFRIIHPSEYGSTLSRLHKLHDRTSIQAIESMTMKVYSSMQRETNKFGPQ